MRSLTSTRYVTIIVTVFFLLSLSCTRAQAAPGDLDKTFGTGGKVRTGLGSQLERAYDMVIQPDGKIVAAGESYFGGNDGRFVVARYNLNGTLDTSFNGTGVVITNFSGDGENAYAVALQPDGKIVAAGNSSNGAALARYNPNGTLDTSFNGTGTATISPGSGYHGTFAVAIQLDGKIVIAGWNRTSSENFAVARYNTDGTLDTTFNGTGVVILDFDSIGVDLLYALAIQPDGKIVAAGSTFSALHSPSYLVVMRYNTDGTLDTTFNGTGIVTTAIGGNNTGGNAVAIQPDGKIVAAGGSYNGANYDFAVVRYNPNGTLDTTFNGTGTVATPIGSFDDGVAGVAIQPNGKIVAAGYSAGNSNGGNSAFALARYNANGTLDTSFGGTGRLTTKFGETDWASMVAIQPDGRIVAAGTSWAPQGLYKIAVVRYLGDTTAVPGNPDASFNGTGTAITSIGSGNSSAGAMVIQPDGKIVVAGSSSNGSDIEFALVRYNPNGTLDTSFNGTGIVTNPIGSSNGRANALALQPDGKIVAAGWSNDGMSFDFAFALARYNPNGTLDTTFNGTGTVVTNMSSGFDIANGVAVQPDGKIVAAGYTSNHGSDFALARYNPNGTLDTSFNGTGIVITVLKSTDNDEATAVAIQPDGKIVAAGYSRPTGAYDFAVVRYNTDGTLDTTFNGTGIVTTLLSYDNDYAYAIALQPDGKIVLAGTGNWFQAFGLVRYNPNGTLDTSFNGTGIVETMVSSYPQSAYDVAVQPDGKIVAAGYSTATRQDFALARYNTDGSLDTSFGVSGTISHDLGSNIDGASAMALQPNGRIVLAGGYGDGTNSDIAVARYFGNMRPRSDFDGDNQSDIAVWNPNNRNWYIRQSRTNTDRVRIDWGSGALGDIAVPRDYDGDGHTDLAVWRPGNGNFYIVQSTTGLDTQQYWGGGPDIPVPADYDGDGRADLAVYRPDEGNWHIVNSATNTVTVRGWGTSTDKPVPGDYDGDGKADIAFYRPSEGKWYIINSASNTQTIRQWGNATDKLVPADYDGDGRTDIAVFRGDEGNWYIINSESNTVTVKNWGSSALGDIAVPADYDLDGKADIAIWRPTEGNWYIINSSTGAVNLLNLGSNGDVPAPATYLPQ